MNDKFREFLRAFAQSSGIAQSDADAAWAAYSRQLSDGERERIESGGAETGMREGKWFRLAYPE